MTCIWPFPEGTPISQPFGSNPSNGFNPAGGHTGTDFAVPTGTPVMAIADGVVRGVGQLPEPYTSNPWWIEGRWAGNVVIIDHGPVVSVSAHLSEWHVNLGDQVTQGQVIGLSGATGGASTGPHCHFETLPDGWDFQNGTYGRVNPATYCTTYFDGTTVNPQSITVKDWFDMADKDTLKAALKEVIEERFPDAEGIPTSLRDLAYIARALVHDVPNQTMRIQVPRLNGGVNTLGWSLGAEKERFDGIGATVLNQAFKLPDGTVTNLAGILTAINAKPVSGGTASDPVAVVHAIRDQLNK